ncbi:MAG: GGDEF domain-containing protein [Kineosporiaceae bacterium]|nr:GGDEF domain-containing protein [Kineosporiaceae bacterium]
MTARTFTGDGAGSPAGPASEVVSDHDAALVAAYELLEITQSTAGAPDLTAQLAEARERGWHHVEFILHDCRLLAAIESGEAVGEVVTSMAAAAEASGDGALVATVHAVRGLYRAHEGIGTEDPDRDLARAVAMLADGAGTPLTRPGAHIACGLAYRRLGLWQLEALMYRRAEDDLARPVRAELGRVVQLNRAVVTVNHIEALTALACEHLEFGDRDRARRELTRTPIPTRQAGLPPAWIAEWVVLDGLLAAVLGEPEPPTHAAVAAALDTMPHSWQRGCHLLARSIRALDTDHRGEAAMIAAEATKLLTVDDLHSLRTLALSIAAGASGMPPMAEAYIALLVEERSMARDRELNSALGRLRAEELALENERLSAQVYVDSLTGLGNRLALERHREELRANRTLESVAVLLLDLNRFKPVNDTYGHRAGDQVLRRIGDLLRRSCRPTDLAVRLGGDEFVVVLNGCDHDLARARAELISTSVDQTDWSDLIPGSRVGVSIGTVAGSPSDIDALLDQADKDMYARKTALHRSRSLDQPTR